LCPSGVQVSTVDAFQGGERDVIIICCTRTSRVSQPASRRGKAVLR
jgi:superfamily I DNA and/or RNA helicase